ncbi:MAG: tyrosine-type recombinase/integrase [Bacillota bacterium]
MRGHIRKRAKDSWTVVVELGRDPETGKRRQKWITVRGTKRDAEAVLAEAVAAANQGRFGLAPSTLTVAALLAAWADASRRKWKPTTEAAHRAEMRIWSEVIGAVPVTKLTAADIERALALFEKERGYAPKTCLRLFATLRCALRWAAKRKLIGTNPAEDVEPPAVPRREVRVWTEEEAAAFLAAAARTEKFALFRVALATGMRLGELLALRWDDVDFDAGAIQVRRTMADRCMVGGVVFQEPKSAASVRRIPLDPGTVQVLREHKRKQAAVRLKAGEAWQDYGLVFCTKNGTPYTHSDVRRVMRSAAKKAGVRRIRFHDIRHTHASLLLRRGVHPKVVAERLGHASVKTTLDTYSHLLPDTQAAAAAAIGEALGGGVSKR